MNTLSHTLNLPQTSDNLLGWPIDFKGIPENGVYFDFERSVSPKFCWLVNSENHEFLIELTKEEFEVLVNSDKPEVT